jgi:hypothetical protein
MPDAVLRRRRRFRHCGEFSGRATFEAAWKEFLPRRSEADFAEGHLPHDPERYARVAQETQALLRCRSVLNCSG